MNLENFSDYECACDGYHTGNACETEIIFPPGEDTNPTEIEDPFPCTWEDPFCIPSSRDRSTGSRYPEC